MQERTPTVLVPVDVSTDEQPDPELLALFKTGTVVLVGWYPVPDQTAPEQLKDQKEAEAVERVEQLASAFPDDGPAIETLVVFTSDRTTTVDRVAEEHGCDVVIVPDGVATVKRVLVPIRSEVNIDRILTVVGAALDESEVSVTLFHATPTEEEREVGELLLSGAKDELVASGIDQDRIETMTVVSESPVEAILKAATDHDVIVIGETEPSLIEEVLGDLPTQVVEQSHQPVLVVRKMESGTHE
jgi:nucleotide-binding universal stress UspA family protein